MEIKDLPAPVYSITVNPNPNLSQFVFGLGNGQIYSCSYEVDKGRQTDADGYQAYAGDFSRVAKDFVYDEQRKRKPYKPTIGTFLTKDIGWNSKINNYNNMN